MYNVHMQNQHKYTSLNKIYTRLINLYLLPRGFSIFRGVQISKQSMLVAYWLKHWTADRKIRGSSPNCNRDLFLLWVHSALSQKLSRRFSFTSFRGEIKPSVLKISLLGISSLTGSSQVNHNTK